LSNEFEIKKGLVVQTGQVTIDPLQGPQETLLKIDANGVIGRSQYSDDTISFLIANSGAGGTSLAVLDGRYVNITGDEMTGPLSINPFKSNLDVSLSLYATSGNQDILRIYDDDNVKQLAVDSNQHLRLSDGALGSPSVYFGNNSGYGFYGTADGFKIGIGDEDLVEYSSKLVSISGRQEIVGRSDVTQFTIQSYSTQTSPQLLINDSSSVELLRLFSDGSNLGFGKSVLTSISGGTVNTAIGNQALMSLTSATTCFALGPDAGKNITTGSNNFCLGPLAGQEITTQTFNTLIGVQAGRDVTGSQNTIVGGAAGQTLGAVSNNVAIGRSSMQNGGGNTSTAIGFQSGQNATGSSCVYIGANAGANNTDNSALFIDNSNTADPLIYGKFNDNFVRINGYEEIIGNQDTEQLVIQSNATQTSPQLTVRDSSSSELFSGRFLNNTKYFLGYQSGNSTLTAGNALALGRDTLGSLTSGTSNTALGHFNLQSVTSGESNTALGYFALAVLTTGSRNLAVGSSLGALTTGTDNASVGVSAGNGLITGISNVMVGGLAMQRCTSDIDFNVALGVEAGRDLKGDGNVCIGRQAGRIVEQDNVCIGIESAENATNAIRNVLIGPRTGQSSAGMEFSVCIGYEAGKTLTRNNTLIIENSSDITTPLIYGEFDNEVVKINGGFRRRISQQDSNYWVQTSDSFLLANASGGDLTYVLPDATTCEGQEYIFKKIDTTSSTVIISSGDLIDLETTFSLTAPMEVINIVSDGSTYWAGS